MRNSAFLLSIIFILFWVGTTQQVFASSIDGKATGSAWSSEIGWINFGATKGNIHVTDAALTGYAWSTNVGWINLNPTKGGVKNDGKGTLSGYAWSTGIGWINFLGVVISDHGVFSGAAAGDNNVTINFSCKTCNVATDWRPKSVRETGSGNIVNHINPFLPGIVENITNQLQNIIASIFNLGERQNAVVLQKETPFAFKGFFSYLPIAKLTEFVLAPLPSDIKFLAEKFPQVKNTFNQVGIKDISDVPKLASNILKLPTLSAITLVKGIPVTQFSSEAKNTIPSEVVFARSGGGLIDFNTSATLNDKGQVEQTIRTITGNTVELIFKPDKPVKKVTGYLVFKSKNASPISRIVSLNGLAASVLFADPNFVSQMAPNVQLPVEGMANNSATAPGTGNTQNPTSLNTAIEQRLVLTTFEYEDTGSGVFKANVQAPLVDGQYEVITVVDYQDPLLAQKEVRLLTVVDPEGYIYEKNNNQETRITGGVVSLYWLNPENNKYELWPAQDFQQENPQVTDVRGTYSFLVPNGFYYLKVDAPGYISYQGKPFQVTEGSGVHMNIEMKTQYWWLKILDWKDILLVIVMLLLAYNFYKDRRRIQEMKDLEYEKNHFNNNQINNQT